MTPLRLEHSHSAPVSNCRFLLCSARTGRNSFAERGTGYSAESLTIAGSLERSACQASRFGVLEQNALRKGSFTMFAASVAWLTGSAFPLARE